MYRLPGRLRLGPPSERQLNELSQHGPAKSDVLNTDMDRMHRAIVRAPVTRPETRAEVLARYPQLRDELEAAQQVRDDLLVWAKLNEPATLSPAGRQALDWILARARLSKRPEDL